MSLYLKIANRIIELMKNDAMLSQIKHFDTNYFGDRKQVVYPACTVVLSGKNALRFFDDGQTQYNLNYDIIIVLKSSKALYEKAYEFDEAFIKLIKDNRDLNGKAVDSRVSGSNIHIENATGSILTYLTINLNVEVIM